MELYKLIEYFNQNRMDQMKTEYRVAVDTPYHEPMAHPDSIRSIDYYDVIDEEAEGFSTRFMRFKTKDGREMVDEMDHDDMIMYNAIQRYDNTPRAHFKQVEVGVVVRPMTAEEFAHTRQMQLAPYRDPLTGNANTRLTNR
jgi:hypothetical protein